MSDGLHADEHVIDPGLVHALLRRTAPELAELPIQVLPTTGSSNALFRLGNQFLVRLPRQPGGGATITKEARCLPNVAARLPVRCPEIVVLGEPGPFYPEHWSVVRWLDGEVPTAGAGGLGLAADLADVVAALRAVDVPSAGDQGSQLTWYRGLPLASRDLDTREHLAACRDIPGLDLDLQLAEIVWDEAMTMPSIHEVSGLHWYHGDLVCENVLIDTDGRLAAVLDFGGLSVGDPTIDLHGAWELLDGPGREVFRTALAVDDVTWLRGRAWALSIALMTLPYYWHTMPRRCADRLTMAHAVLEDARATR